MCYDLKRAAVMPTVSTLMMIASATLSPGLLSRMISGALSHKPNTTRYE